MAMSGGVDSSVAAALLLEQGYDVFGLMLRLWVEEGCGSDNRCCPPSSVAMARRVAAQLDIPFYVLDAQAPFHHAVVDYTVREYAAGRTPNPCIECNRVVRWGYLLREARALGAHFLATGHYARVIRRDDKFVLLRGLDAHKDQSYMLSTLGQPELASSIFPLGEWKKNAVREKAAALNLPVANQPDSQDLCFVPDGNYRRFLANQMPESLQPGPIINRSGKIIGQHNGLPGYTIGQRKRIQVNVSEPYYVLAKDSAQNALIVGTMEELGGKIFISDNIHWVDNDLPAAPFQADVQIRYTSPPKSAEVNLFSKDEFRVEFDESVRDITPGQAAVFYHDDQCLGMAFIREVIG
jgi:tRNA-specific 2-thiouridylase